MSTRREITKKYAGEYTKASRAKKGRLLEALVALQKVWRLSGQSPRKYLAASMDDPLTVPGLLELNTVAHCRHTLKGKFLRTLTGTDPVSGWTMLRTIRNNAYVHIHRALEWMVGHAQVPVAGIDFDIHTDWCRRPGAAADSDRCASGRLLAC